MIDLHPTAEHTRGFQVSADARMFLSKAGLVFFLLLIAGVMRFADAQLRHNAQVPQLVDAPMTTALPLFNPSPLCHIRLQRTSIEGTGRVKI